jgi:Icc protein
MNVDALPLRLAHLAGISCGEPLHRPGLLSTVVDAVGRQRPDAVVVAGDLTAAGYAWEYEQALAELDRLEAPRLAVPGSQDSRNVGYVHFERLVGERFVRLRIPLEESRAQRIGATGVTIVGLDSSQPDLEDGHVGREWYPWLREQCQHPDDLRIVVLHHHVVSIPGAGRDLNHVTDAGDLLPILDELKVDAVLTGHRHVPYFWGVNGMLLANAGTAATHRTRGTVPPSWNELVIDAESIKVFLHYPDGRRDLAVIRSRTSRRTVREGFHVTDAFLTSNALPVS